MSRTLQFLLILRVLLPLMILVVMLIGSVDWVFILSFYLLGILVGGSTMRDYQRYRRGTIED